MRNPGEIIETSEIQSQIPGVEKGIKLLYQSRQGDGKPRRCSGVVFLPKLKKVKPSSVAWAHGTIGMGDTLAPSSQKDPGRKIPQLEDFMQHGCIVTATDYSGLGTPGIQNYLIGRDEAEDIVNLVRAARQLDGLNISNKFAIFGHSQGGHGALFTGLLAKTIAPELDLKCVVAQCPPTLLPLLLERQKNSVVAWIIGPQIATAWPDVYTDLNITELLTQSALKNYKRMALMRTEAAGLEGILRSKLGQKFFKIDPNQDPVLNQALKDQTPGPIKAIPCLIVQGLLDRLVLPDITRKYVDQSKAQGSNIEYVEIPTGTHNSITSQATKQVNNFLSKYLS